ncbi:MAG TPA: NUDIX domain-containing protein [Candidatus Saccharimonadales bacterium]|jgi:isopentenyldiphosphate isomerase|nr:NUDIX domain-containing protein [Candidatus Saccharimonadales bacterium]
MSAPILIVDEHDNPVGSATKQEAWAQGLWHRIVRITLEDGQGNVLLQHRSPTKDIYPNCWDNSAAGHVDAGEDYDTAAYRELHEELGLNGLKLLEIGAYIDEHTWQGYRMKRFVKVYTALITGTPSSAEPDKIDDVRWFTIADAKKLVAEDPGHASDGLVQVIERFY